MMKYTNLFSLFTLVLLFFACGQPAAEETEVVADENKPVAPVEAAPAATGLKVGDIAPDFSLRGIDDQEHSLKTVRDANGEVPKGYAVTFTCNTCPFAKGYEDRLVALHTKLSAMGYPVVAVQPNDTSLKPGDNMEAMKQRAADKGFNFLYLLDEKQEVYPKYGASKTPEVYLLDAGLKVRYHGAIDDNAQNPEAVTINYVEAAVAALEAGRNPDPADVKAIGCSIKAK